MNNNFDFCPKCGSKKIISVKRECKNETVFVTEFADRNISPLKWNCPECGFTLYCNVATASGVIISDSENNVLFEVRGKEPQKGFLAIPGGFTDADETVEEGCIRECREEIGLELSHEDITYIGSFPNTYEYKGISYKTCDFFFMTKIPENKGTIPELVKKLHPEESEVTSIQIHKIRTEEDVDSLPIAFPSSVKVLKLFVKKHAE